MAIQKNLLILLLSSLLIWLIIAIDPFNILSSLILLTSLILVISFWYKNGVSDENENDTNLPKYVPLKLTLSLVFLVFAAWLITFGANQILDEFSLGELFIGYTVLAIGTSLPEIAASVSLALRGRYETVTGTLIGSNIFNGLCVLAIPGLFMNPKMSLGWTYSEWSPLLFILFVITFIFTFYIFSVSKKQRNASISLSFLFLSSYFVSLYFAY
ncbi:hypothetical protein M9C81_05575 [SAR86 cluster bacterium]|nr:hypothetical protein M9C81_05575 [SAR86 cluster bacterium]